MKQYVVINDAALGQWKIEVWDLCEHINGECAFEGAGEAIDLTTGEACKDAEFLEMLYSYALEEGYYEQNISMQCKLLMDQWFAANPNM